MGQEIFSTVIEQINKNILNKKENSISSDNFKKIENKDNNKNIAFIDGGNVELLKAVDFSLQFIRCAGVIFKNNKKIKTKITEFFVLVNSVIIDDKINYETKIFPVKGDGIKDIQFDSLDNTIRDGTERASVSKIGGIARRFAELELAKDIVSELGQEDIVVLDGSLKCLVTNEKEIMKGLYDKADEKNIIMCGLAKTSRLFSKDMGLLSQIHQVGSDLNYEFYYPIENTDDYESFAVRLNKNSKYIFEFNIKQKDKVEDVLNLLVLNSNDAVFPGYPYGLILADKFARVSNEEKEYLFIQLQTKAGMSWNKIKNCLNVLNTHDILDNIG